MIQLFTLGDQSIGASLVHLHFDIFSKILNSSTSMGLCLNIS